MLGADEPYPVPSNLADENGAELWLRYPEVPIPGRLGEYRAALSHVVSTGGGASLDLAEAELLEGLSGLTGTTVTLQDAVQSTGGVVIGTPTTSPLIADLALASRLAPLGPEGYLVETAEVGGGSAIVVAANSEIGVLYGAFALLRHLQSHSSLNGLSLASSPRVERRLLNHWDNLDRSVERGYAGRSLWDWNALPATISPRYTDYARANASLGINGVVLTNVNADAQVLTAAYLAKVKALADVFRPYGIKAYLTARFSAPVEIGGLASADPASTDVQQWWVAKADEIYSLIPDFGGFLVKANSEGQPGPQDYGRNHADGANALAAAVAPHGGIVMWRAFVYSAESPADRITQAYDEFKPLDGQFDDGVLVQVKNGPLDFQPREPFHSLFGAMPSTPLVLELQITKEYLGQDTHLAYLGPLFEEALKSDTKAGGEGSTVAKVIDGTLHDYAYTAIAGVANVGDDANWTGSHFNQANWYAFGRMAWDLEAPAERVAEEWVRQTFSNDPAVVAPVVEMMMSSREAVVDYMTPLGLVHIMASNHHYGPGAWVDDLSRADWNPVYYHRADAQGIGFDRTSSGSNAVSQYSPAVGQAFADRQTVPDELLLFFHRVGWQEALSSGRTLWDELVHRYSRGVDQVGAMRDSWATVSGRIDAQRFDEVDELLGIQHYEARWWRDASLSYFAAQSQLPIPTGYAAPAQPLSFYQGLTCPTDVTKPRCPAIYSGEPSPAGPP
jgi:alpha-glucuronidase